MNVLLTILAIIVWVPIWWAIKAAWLTFLYHDKIKQAQQEELMREPGSKGRFEEWTEGRLEAERKVYELLTSQGIEPSFEVDQEENERRLRNARDLDRMGD